MRYLRNAVLAILALAPAASAQRAVNTGKGTTTNAFEFGVDVGSVTLGLEKPKSLAVSLDGQAGLRFAWFFTNAMAFEPRARWYSIAQESSVGYSTYMMDFGLLYGLGSMDPGEKPWYVRPAVAISGGSGGQRSYTTLSGAFGMRRSMHGMLMHNELVLSRQLESGPVAARTMLQLRHGISLRRQ